MARYFNVLEALREERRQEHEIALSRLSKLRRQVRDNAEPFALPDTEFMKIYRLSKSTTKELIREIEPFMPAGRRSSSIPNPTKILTALSFYAMGSYQRGIGMDFIHGLSQPSVSKCIHEVTAALNNAEVVESYIKFPHTRQERDAVVQGFSEKFDFPGVLGCIDGTHVAMIRPTEQEERFFNHIGYHSRNVQIICDVDLNIMNMDASYGGATHDSFIWRYSHIHDVMETLHGNGEPYWLLGDSGYPPRPWLMTPITHAPLGSPERHYYDRHVAVRNTVERCIGVLKARWRCLLAHRTLHYDHIMAGKIINACCVLHNVATKAGQPYVRLNHMEDARERALQDDPERQINAGAVQRLYGNDLQRGTALRQHLVRRLWR